MRTPVLLLATLAAAAAAPGESGAPPPTPCAPSEGGGSIALPAGTRLRASPDAAAPSVAVVDADVSLPVVSRCGAFAEVRWEGLRGWARPGDAAGPALERPPREADLARLRRVRDAMRPLGREDRLGPWRVLTDVAKGELTGLDAVAAHLPAAYEARYGAKTGVPAGQAVAIFASDVRYRSFAQADGSLMLSTRGHAGGGLAAFAMGRNPLETRVTLVHELTHLLSRNALGERIADWLDEGIAEDLAWCRVGPDGRLEPDTLDVFQASRPRGSVVEVERSGPRVTADDWLARARTGRLTPLSALLAPDGRLFSNPSARRDASTESAMLVRFALATPERARRFREFLRSISFGGAGDLESFAGAMGMDESTLSKRFLEWLSEGALAR